MLTLLIFFVLGILVGAAMYENFLGFLGEVLLVTFLGLVVAAVIIDAPYDPSKEVIRYSKIIPVNGYYVDPEGNWVTEDNSRGEFNLPIALPSNRVNGDLYVKFESKTHQKSIWSLSSGMTEKSEKLVLAIGD